MPLFSDLYFSLTLKVKIREIIIMYEDTTKTQYACLNQNFFFNKNILRLLFKKFIRQKYCFNFIQWDFLNLITAEQPFTALFAHFLVRFTIERLISCFSFALVCVVIVSLLRSLLRIKVIFGHFFPFIYFFLKKKLFGFDIFC